MTRTVTCHDCQQVVLIADSPDGPVYAYHLKEGWGSGPCDQCWEPIPDRVLQEVGIVD